MDIPDEFAPTEWELAVAHPESHLVGWDPGGQWCGLFLLEHNTARLVDDREYGLDEARELPLRKAVCYRQGSYLWAIDARGCSVWSRLFSIVLDERGDVLELPGRKLARRDVVAVQAFTDDQDPRRVGVELVLVDGTCTETMMSVRDGDDGAWARDLAARLAERWAVPYRHVVPGGYKAAWLRAQAASAQQTRALIDGLVEAAIHYDDPDRVASRAEREAERDRRDSQIAAHAYITTGQLRIAAWDRDAPETLTIVVADRTADEPLMRVVERRTVDASERDAVTAQHRRARDVIGATYRRSLVYWVFDDAHCSVFRRRGELTALARFGDELEVGKRRIPVERVRGVVAFAVPERYGHRGLALELVDGEYVLIEEDQDAQYDRGPAGTLRAGWSEAVAPELAAALGVPSRVVHGDVIVRPPPPTEPAARVLAACGAPVFAHTLSEEERTRARREGRVVHVYEWGWRSMGDGESHGVFAVIEREKALIHDGDLVFATAVPTDIDGRWDTWETVADVYRAFGIEPPARVS